MAKRKRNLSRPVIFALVILVSLATGSYYISDYFYKPSFRHYEAFGIDLPVNFYKHGIDVSKYQEEISWEDVKGMKVKGITIGFAFIKATEGLGNVDDCFRRNWFNSKRAGITRGAYHYFISSRSGKAQAQNFIETVRLQKGDLPPVIDIEQTNGVAMSDLRQRVKDWLQAVEKKYRVKPIIYTNADFYKNFLSGSFDEYPLWVAHYLVKDKPRINRDWFFWQHNESGHVNGINSEVDFNVYNGDSAGFEKLLLK